MSPTPYELIEMTRARQRAIAAAAAAADRLPAPAASRPVPLAIRDAATRLFGRLARGGTLPTPAGCPA